MGTLAAIDIGSNAIRLVIGDMNAHGDIRLLKKVREPVRLGHDVFADGSISTATLEKAIGAFMRFRELLKAHGVVNARAVGTSALREAKNRDVFVKEVLRVTGIQIHVIDGIEEGRLIHSAVAHRVDLTDRVALLIDIGGGSVELTVSDHGRVIGTRTFKLGTVRMLQLMAERGLQEHQLAPLIEEHLKPARDFLRDALKNRKIDMAIGTGGNLECLGKLRVALLQRNSIFSMSRHELGALVDHLASMSVPERILFLRLRPDRADVVIPAALVTQAVMKEADVELLQIPYVGLRDGILAQLGAALESTR